MSPIGTIPWAHTGSVRVIWEQEPIKSSWKAFHVYIKYITNLDTVLKGFSIFSRTKNICYYSLTTLPLNGCYFSLSQLDLSAPFIWMKCVNSTGWQLPIWQKHHYIYLTCTKLIYMEHSICNALKSVFSLYLCEEVTNATYQNYR